MKHEINDRELHTTLAALRYWQREGWRSEGHEHEIASDNDTVEPLTAGEIDDFCERINVADEPGAPVSNPVKQVCSTCGSEDVVIDAWAEWDVDGQRWVLHSVMGKPCHCDACDGETSIVEEPLDMLAA